MNDLPMPSEVKKLSAQAEGQESAPQDLIEPPSVKLIVRLFLIPLVIVAAAVGVMFLIGSMAGGTPSLEEAIAQLKRPGGERTGTWMIGPGSKQRYIYAQALTDKMKAGMTEAERIKLAGELEDVLRNFTQENEGEVRHFVILALGRAWQNDPTQPPMNGEQAVESRRRTMDTLLEYARSKDIATRKAALLATAYRAGQDDAGRALPLLIETLGDEKEDLDVRLAAATALGPLATPQDAGVIAALHHAMGDSDPKNVELVWASALSLAQLNQSDVADTILKLLDRKELAQLQYYDRETDAKNAAFRGLSDQEQQRILINTMIGAKHLKVASVQDKLKDLAANDPSTRVRAAASEVLREIPPAVER